MIITRPKRVKLSLDLAPLIDVVFQLLIFFMLTTSFAVPMMSLNLPSATNKEEKKSDLIIINISKEGGITINNQPVVKDQLITIIQNQIASSKNSQVAIRADRQMPYEHFVEVMDLARQAGAKQINIVHRHD